MTLRRRQFRPKPRADGAAGRLFGLLAPDEQRTTIRRLWASGRRLPDIIALTGASEARIRAALGEPML